MLARYKCRENSIQHNTFRKSAPACDMQATSRQTRRRDRDGNVLEKPADATSAPTADKQQPSEDAAESESESEEDTPGVRTPAPDRRLRDFLRRDPKRAGVVIERLTSEIAYISSRALKGGHAAAAAAPASSPTCPMSGMSNSTTNFLLAVLQRPLPPPLIVLDANAVPQAAPSDVLSEAELRAYYHFVGSNGRCRRDCPELYPHLMKKMETLRHENDDDAGEPDR